MQGKEAAKEAIRKRSGGAKAGGKAGGAGDMKFFSEEAPGLKVHPKSVLIISLVYIGLVFLLHIWSKIKAEPAKAQAQ